MIEGSSLFALYGVGHCLGEVSQRRDALADLLCAEARIGNDFHQPNAVDKMRISGVDNRGQSTNLDSP